LLNYDYKYKERTGKEADEASLRHYSSTLWRNLGKLLKSLVRICSLLVKMKIMDMQGTYQNANNYTVKHGALH
jgi:hypothetical protein